MVCIGSTAVIQKLLCLLQNLAVRIKCQRCSCFFKGKPHNFPDFFLLNSHIGIIRMCQKEYYRLRTARIRAVFYRLPESIYKLHRKAGLFSNLPLGCMMFRLIFLNMTFTNGNMAFLHPLNKIQPFSIQYCINHRAAAFFLFHYRMFSLKCSCRHHSSSAAQ